MTRSSYAWKTEIRYMTDILLAGKSKERQRVACWACVSPGSWHSGIGVNRRLVFPGRGEQERGIRFTLHAEEDALRRLCFGGWVGCFFVLRLTPGGRIALARPCDSCMRMLLRAGAREIYWTTNNGTVEGGKTGL